MNKIVPSLAVAASVGATALVLSASSAAPALAQTFKPLMALIINDATNPVPVVDVGTPAAAPEPFQHQVSSFVPTSLVLQVPTDKRLVIEFYSGTAATEAPCAAAAMTIKTDLGAESMQHRLLATPVEQGQPSDFNQYTVSQQVRLYAAPGSVVQFAASTIPACPAAFLGAMSGYLIAVP
jgi:hypothetical protein